MDKVSAILIFGIMGLVMMSSYIVFDTWLQNPGYDEEILVFNDDTSVVNNSDETLWVRAKVDQEATEGDVAIELKINDKSWVDGKDGWHYYAESLKATEDTEPFAISYAEPSTNAKSAALCSFRVKVEAIEESRLSEKVENSKDAFLLLKRERQEAEPKFL